MKKLSMFQLLLLVVFGALAIAGVLVFALAIGGGTTNTVGAIKIWGTLDQGAFATVLRQASENQGQLTQVTYEQKDPKTYENELTNALAGGSGPDLFLLRQDYALRDASKVALIPLSALSEAQFENTFVEAASPFLSQKGIVGVPLLADPLILYWNKDILAAAGFAQPLKFWDELYKMSVKITQKDDAGTIRKATIAFGEYQNISAAKDILATLILQAGGSITAYDSGERLTPALTPRTGDTSQASASALRFFSEFADPSKNYYSWNRSLPEAQKAFAAGDVAFYVGYASEEPTIARTNSNLNFAVAPLPQIRGGPRALGTARVYALAASRVGKKPTAAITAAFLLASAENSKALSVALGIPSARRDVANQAAQGTDDLFNKQAILAHSWLDPDPERTASLFRAMIENTTSGTLLVSEAIQRADQEMAQILGL